MLGRATDAEGQGSQATNYTCALYNVAWDTAARSKQKHSRYHPRLPIRTYVGGAGQRRPDKRVFFFGRNFEANFQSRPLAADQVLRKGTLGEEIFGVSTKGRMRRRRRFRGFLARV